MFAWNREKGLSERIASLETELAHQKLLGSSQAAKLRAIDRSMASIEFDTNGIVLNANENFLKALGYSIDEIVGKHHRIFVLPAEAESREYAEFWRRLSRGEYFSAEYRRISKSRREVWIEASYNPVIDSEGKIRSIIKFASEITSKKRDSVIAESKLEAIERSFATIEFKLDGTVLSANSNFLATMGYSLDEIAGRHHRMFVSDSYAASEAYREFWGALNEGKYHTGLFDRIGKWGKEVCILATYNPVLGLNGEIASVIKYATDVTKAEMSRKANARISQSLAESVSDIRDSIDQISKNVEQTTSLSVDTEVLAKSTQQVAQNLGEGSRKIGQIVEVIQDLAEQTNLLALNATIESARAGEVGKGFAVVATEVKALSQQTANATKGIAETIADIQKCISEVIQSTSRISDRVTTVNENMSTISSSVNHQSATMTLVAGNAKELQFESPDTR